MAANTFAPVNAAPYAWPLRGSWNTQDTAVICIDMQRDFLDPRGYFAALGEASSALTRAIEPAKAFLAYARNQGFLILYTRESHRPELVDLNQNKRQKAVRQGSPVGSQGPLGKLLIRGEEGCDFYEGFAPNAGEIVIDKPGNSAFYATDLEHILRVKEIKNLILLGVTTDVCVSSTMRDGNDRGYDCLLLSDCSAAATDELHASFLASIECEGGIFGAHIQSTQLIG